jgi:hypothetical protein
MFFWYFTYLFQLSTQFTFLPSTTSTSKRKRFFLIFIVFSVVFCWSSGDEKRKILFGGKMFASVEEKKELFLG